MKKVFRTLLCAGLVLSLAACGGSNSNTMATTAEVVDNEAGEGAYVPGIYTGTAAGHNGELTVEVEVSAAEILSVTVIEHVETDGISDPAIQNLPGEIVTYQSLGVDTVSGATVTSQAILDAVEDAIAQAGGDVAALKAVAVVKTAKDDIEETVDVIVVGGGGAGIAAAASAVQNGASVILIEKTAALGGNTLASGGVINGVYDELWPTTENEPGRNETLREIADMPDTAFPAEYLSTFKTLQNDIEQYLAGDTTYMFDSVELHIIQTYLGGLRQDLDGNDIYGDFNLVETMIKNVAITVKWMSDELKSEFTSVLTEPIGSMWKRSVSGVDKTDALFNKPAAYVEANGGVIMYETTAEELIVEAGKVVGVKGTQSDGTKVTIYANNGVVLATGGFGANIDMVIEYNHYWKDLYPEIGTTNVGSTVGEGLVMAEAVDAALTGMEFTQLMPIGFASTGKLALGNGANVIYLSPEGTRYVNEYAERDVLSQAAYDNGGEHGLFYELGNVSTVQSRASEEDIYDADTLEELAEMLGMDASVLIAEVEKYNEYVDNAFDPEYGKNVFTAKIEAPYTARAMRPSIHHTMGGLVIDTECHVYNNNGEVIEGLYAAGEITGGIHGGNRLGGNAIADIYTYGKIAGESAALAK